MPKKFGIIILLLIVGVLIVGGLVLFKKGTSQNPEQDNGTSLFSGPPQTVVGSQGKPKMNFGGPSTTSLAEEEDDGTSLPPISMANACDCSGILHPGRKFLCKRRKGQWSKC